jgi:DNA-binding CsgD family transcriptional regulator/tetratricopeptide (TPR) repeat protein
VPVAEVFATSAGLLDFGRPSLYGPPRDVPDQEPHREAIASGAEVPDYFIERPRLTKLLDEATAPVIMLIAPAGFGKTTLARQWLAHRRRGWYRGSPAAADVAALAVGMAQSAGEIVPDAGRRMGERLRATGTPEQDVEPLAELLAEDLADWPEDAWLAFDDYQFASESSFAEEFVARVLALCPLKLFLTSRKRPSWATSRRLLYGDIYEIGRSLLAMSQEEAEQVLAHRRGSEASGLVALADGWPAVIGLAALTDEIELPDEGLPEALYAYFAEELYQAAEPELRWSLSQLSLSSAVAPAVAEAVLGDQAAGALRDGRRLGFLVPSEQGIDEIHPLLRAFLEEKFRELSGDRAPEIVELVVRTHLGREEWDDAFSIVERFFDADLLVEVVETALPRVLLEARLPTLARWVECAVQHEVDAPVFDLAEGELAFRAADRTRSEALGLQAARRFEEGHPLMSRSFALAGASAHQASHGLTALDYYGRAEDVAVTPADRRQAVWGRFLSMVALEREDGAARALRELEDMKDTSADGVLRAANGRLMLATLRGDIRDSVDEMTITVPLAAKATDKMIESSALNAYAATLVLLSRYSDAHSVASRELELADEYRLEFVKPHANLHRAAALCGLREFKQSIALLEGIRRSCKDHHFILMNIGTVLARIYLALGSPDRALRALEEHLGAESTPGMDAEFEAWWGLVLACLGRADEAAERASAATAVSRRTEVAGLVPWIETVSNLLKGDSSPDRAIHAFRTSRDTGNTDAFVTAYRACRGVLKAVAIDKSSHRELRLILSNANDPTFGGSIGLHVPISPSSRSTLTKRERDVLSLLVQGATNREIARALFIVEATVKLHLRHIYAKFGVRSRAEAIVRALDEDLDGE